MDFVFVAGLGQGLLEVGAGVLGRVFGLVPGLGQVVGPVFHILISKINYY